MQSILCNQSIILCELLYTWSIAALCWRNWAYMGFEDSYRASIILYIHHHCFTIVFMMIFNLGRVFEFYWFLFLFLSNFYVQLILLASLMIIVLLLSSRSLSSSLSWQCYYATATNLSSSSKPCLNYFGISSMNYALPFQSIRQNSQICCISSDLALLIGAPLGYPYSLRAINLPQLTTMLHLSQCYWW